MGDALHALNSYISAPDLILQEEYRFHTSYLPLGTEAWREWCSSLALVTFGVGSAAGFMELVSHSREYVSILSEEQYQRLKAIVPEQLPWQKVACSRSDSESYLTSLDNEQTLVTTGQRTGKGRFLEVQLEGGDYRFLYRCMFHAAQGRDRNVISELIESAQSCYHESSILSSLE